MHIIIFVYNVVLPSTSDKYHNTCTHFHENIMINTCGLMRSTNQPVHVQCLYM